MRHLVAVRLWVVVTVIHGASGCSSTQFQCDNGQCVSSSFRCNGWSRECSDGSDERNCINIVGIAVGLSVAGFVLYGVLPIVICVIIGCCSARASSRRPRTVFTTATQPATVTVNTKCSQQGDSKSYTPAGTDVKLASRDEMSTYPPPTETSCSPPLYP